MSKNATSLTIKVTGSGTTAVVGAASIVTGVLWSFQGLTGTGTRNLILSAAAYGNSTSTLPLTMTGVISHLLWGKWAGPGDATSFFAQTQNYFHPVPRFRLQSQSVLNVSGTVQGGDIVLVTLFLEQ